MLLMAAIVLAGVGLVLVVVGLRGRRIDDDPICRVCGFDLSGVYPGPGAGSGGGAKKARCPECGADLTDGRRVRHGHRRPRPRFITGGTALAAAGVLGGGLLVWASMTRQDLNPFKPGWLLALNARAGDEGALREAIKRLEDGELSRTAATVLVDRALAEQGDPSGRWFGQWDAVFGAAWASGAVSGGQLEVFARQAFDLSLEHREAVRRRRPWAANQVRGAIRAPSGVQADYRLQSIRVGEHTVYFYEHASEHTDQARTWSPRPTGRHVDPVSGRPLRPIDLPPGEYEVRATFLVWAPDVSGEEPLTASSRVDVLSRITVIDDDRELVELASEDMLGEGVSSAVRPRSTTIYLETGRAWTWGGIDIQHPPVHVGFDVILRAGERQWPVGYIVGGPDDFIVEMYGGREFPLDGFEPTESGTIDLMLVPSARTAEERLAQPAEKIWGETVVLEGVPFKLVDRTDQ